MAEHGEIPTAWAGIAAAGTFIGGLIAALFGPWKMPGTQPESGDTKVLAEKLGNLERRQNEMDDRITEVFHLLGDVKDSLSKAQADIREALTRLEERRK